MNRLSRVFNRMSGVYKITNSVNNKVYIGRSTNLYGRCCQYFAAFKTKDKRKINHHLMNAMSKYGFDKFIFDVIELCDVSDTPLREQSWIECHRSTNREYGYNIRTDVDGAMVLSKETSEKISTRLKHEWSKGVRKNHSIKLKKAWVNRDRKEQSLLMSKNLTRYKYQMSFPTGEVIVTDFKCLKGLGYESALSNFHRHKTNTTIVKQVKIERLLL